VLYLGADVTVDGWVAAMRQTRARAAVVAVPTPVDTEPASAVIRALRDEGVALIAVGGGAAGTMAGEGVLVLPNRVSDAADVVARAVGRRG
jgi:carbamate kinase